MSWREITLGEAIHIKHGYAFKSQYFYSSGPFMLLTPGNFYEKGGFRIRLAKERFYIGDFPEDFILSKDDLIVAMTEQGAGLLGSSAWIPEPDKYLHNQRLGKIDEIDENILNKKFLYHLFNTYSVRSQISGSATGTKVRHTAPERIYKIKVRVPNVNSQSQIAVIIDVYDDLIENNRRRIQLLEESAGLLYKEWFIHLRFPGHKHTKIVDGVPEGWEKAVVADFGKVITGKTPPTKNNDNYGEDVLFIKTPDMHVNSVIIDTVQKLSVKGVMTQQKKTLPPYSILMACIGAKLGVVSLNAVTAQTNQQINSIIPKYHELFPFCFFSIKALKANLIALSASSTMPNVNKTKFESLPVVFPKQSLIKTFYNIASPCIEQIKNLNFQNQKLAEARNLLLPRLMTGEVEV